MSTNRRSFARLAAIAVALLGALVLAGSASAVAKKKPAKPKERYHLNLVAIEADPGADLATFEAPIRAELAAQIGARVEFVPALDGAPDPAKDPAAFEKWAKRQKLRAYDLRVKVVKATRTLKPIEGSSDQMLEVNVVLQLMGMTVPSKGLGFTGTGTGFVAAQVGKKVPPKVDADVQQKAIAGAIAQALDEALSQLKNPPPPPPKTPKKPAAPPKSP